MSAEAELLWPGVALLLLLGAVASLCVRCSRPGKGGILVGAMRGRCTQRPSQTQAWLRMEGAPR